VVRRSALIAARPPTLAAPACLALALLSGCNERGAAEHPNAVMGAEPPPTVATGGSGEQETRDAQKAQTSDTCPRYLSARRHVLHGSKSTRDLVLIDIVTGKLRPLVAQPRSGSVAWSPSGAYLALPAPKGGVIVVEIATGNTWELQNATTEFRFSGNGRFLLYDEDDKIVAVEFGSGIEAPLPTGSVWLASHPSEPWAITQEGECAYLVDVSGKHSTRVIDRVGPGSAVARFSSKGDQFVVGDRVNSDGVIPRLRAGATTGRVPQSHCGELTQQCKPFDCVCGDAPWFSRLRAARVPLQCRR